MSEIIDVTDNPMTGKFVIAPDGSWMHDGEEITHVLTWKFLSKSLRADADGRIYLSDGRVRVNVLAQDAPLVVTAIRKDDDGIRLRFHDDTYGYLDPRTISFRGNVPYCAARHGLTAKFTAAAYMQLAEFVKETKSGFELVLDDEAFPLTYQMPQ